MEKRDGKIERAQVVAGRKARMKGADARSVKLQNRLKSAPALDRRRCPARLRGSMNDITIRVPGTTANLGPGFDCLGVALQIYNHVTVSKVEGRRSKAEGMAAAASDLFFKATKAAPFAFDWKIAGDVPQSRGMGSSVTVRLGLLHGLNELAGRPQGAEQLFELCAQLEGHPDNAAPAAFGGFTVAKSDTQVVRAEVDAALKFVLLIPDFEVSTPEARAVLPETLDRRVAVASCVNACRVTAAFLTRQYELLRGSFTDGFHQPHREPLIPFLSRVIAAGEEAGALGGYLSGSGSTICCVTLDRPEAVAAAMLAASGNAGARTVITTADNEGVRVVASVVHSDR
jgi:homoserine kinase